VMLLLPAFSFEQASLSLEIAASAPVVIWISAKAFW